MKSFLRLALLLVLLAPTLAVAGALDGYGVVFLHGKGMWPGAFDGGIPALLESEGAAVISPEMPWSTGRIYGATYDQAMAEVDAAVATLKTRGVRRVVVIGHSLGANAAIGYAARRSGVAGVNAASVGIAGVVALAPGHLPETSEMQGRTREAVAEAKALVASGQGGAPQTFPDLVQGIPTLTRAAPVVYLSMFDPSGPAVIPRNVAALREIPLLWVSGNLDPIYWRGRDYAFAFSKSPKSRYVEVFASHLSTSLAARGTVLEWMKSL